MAKNMQPSQSAARAGNFSCCDGVRQKDHPRNPGSQMRRKKGEYALQLQEKQKVKFVYGILEKQFRSYYEKATRMEGRPGENLLIPGGAPPGQRGIPSGLCHHPAGTPGSW